MFCLFSFLCVCVFADIHLNISAGVFQKRESILNLDTHINFLLSKYLRYANLDDV